MTETARPPLRRVVVLIPTYNERDTLPVIVRRLREVVPQVDVVVLDDNSPDGTGAVADALAADDPQVHVLHRAGKEGLGAAYLAGFRWALDAGYDAVVEMDADGSHRPEHLPTMLAARRARGCRHRLALGARRLGGQLAGAPQGALASAATSTSRCCSGCRSTTRRPATGSTAATRCGRWGWRTSPRRATASRST